MGETHNVDLKQAPELDETVVQGNSGNETEKTLDVKITPIKTEGASQSTCHNPCM